jgi:hypothetical protein
MKTFYLYPTNTEQYSEIAKYPEGDDKFKNLYQAIDDPYDSLDTDDYIYSYTNGYAIAVFKFGNSSIQNDDNIKSINSITFHAVAEEVDSGYILHRYKSSISPIIGLWTYLSDMEFHETNDIVHVSQSISIINPLTENEWTFDELKENLYIESWWQQMPEPSNSKEYQIYVEVNYTEHPVEKKLPKIIQDNSFGINRARQISKKGDDRFEDIKVDLYDIDGSIKYYFDNVILPKIDTEYGVVDVPIIYASPSRWASIKKHGGFRDEDGKIQSPMITYKRTSISKNTDMPVNKISAENPQLFYTYEEQYNSRNKYSQFSVLTGIKPQKKIRRVVIPDYVILTYDIIIWTDKLRQMNKLIELMNYYAGSYWGTKKWKFKSEINDYSDSAEVGSDTAKVIKWNCSLELRGYIVPDIYAKHLPNTKVYDPETIVVNYDTDK